MMFNNRGAKEDAGFNSQMETELIEALGNFRSSVHAWSDAEFARPRAVMAAEQRRTWRRAAAWALGCVLAAGSLSAGVFEHQHHDQLARIAARQQAAQRIAQQKLAARQAAEQIQIQDEKLMAAVDKDVSQDVPSALEPLAQLMDDNGN